MMTSTEIRQSFLEFFRSKQHTLVPSASLMPDAPNLLFTNAGMNQFVPIFLAEKKADVASWAGAVPALDTRAADTQKCIRAGGKHNDLEDVGLDTYHHTLFEMLGNWSFGDYFKKEAISWAWELITEVWKFPKERLYATVYQPGPGDPAEFDQEAYDYWAELFSAAGLDPKVHICFGGKKDNFWMMGDTGPCGPCSELHIDLTPKGDTQGKLVNQGKAECIEIWNLVFIQFAAGVDGSFAPLPARHVDTGMGFERVVGVMQCTQGFKDFSRLVSNYETDVFRPIFERLEQLSGKKYGSTLPRPDVSGRLVPQGEQEQVDVAFRVIADHIRTLTCAAADGIRPGNKDRNYVLRRILRRAVRYGRTLGLTEPFFYELADVVVGTLGGVFPELVQQQSKVKEVLRAEEVAFNKTLDRGIQLFTDEVGLLGDCKELSAEVAFRLFDEQGFPSDLTELMARERGLTVDLAGFQKLMEEQRERSRTTRKKTVIEVSSLSHQEPTRFMGFDEFSVESEVLEVVEMDGARAVILGETPFYAEMGGQVGDTGSLEGDGSSWQVSDTRKAGDTWLHLLDEVDSAPEVGQKLVLRVDMARRSAIQRHHTVTHLLHWALHEVVGTEATQKGSYVGPEKLTFDFNSAALSEQQVRDIESLVNERILENAGVFWSEASYQDVRQRADIMQFFGDKYGDRVRVVQVGGRAGGLDGYSMELCGGTHCRATGEIGLFRVASESAVAAGVRRIEAVAGMESYRRFLEESMALRGVAGRINSPLDQVERKIESILLQQKELERQVRTMLQERASLTARELIRGAEEVAGVPWIISDVGRTDDDTLQAVVGHIRGEFSGVAVLVGDVGGDKPVKLMALVGSAHTAKFQAGKIIQAIAPLVEGRGGGKPDFAQGGGAKMDGIPQVLAALKAMRS